MSTLSLDLRQRILASYDAGEGTRQDIADRYRVSLGMVKKLLSQRKKTGDIAPRHSYSGRKPYFTQEHRQQIKALIDRQPDITLWEIREQLNLDCTLPAIHYVLRDMGMSFKKTLHASEQGREDVKLARAEWIAMQGQLDITRLVFIDEAGAKTNMTRLYGRSLKGVRAYDHAPHGHWCTTTMISSIRCNGETACMAVDAAKDNP